MEKVSGCVEHTEALTEMLQDAKKNGNPIMTTWLDLQNAYGTAPHNLIQGCFTIRVRDQSHLR